jgi:hypothetical protein
MQWLLKIATWIVIMTSLSLSQKRDDDIGYDFNFTIDFLRGRNVMTDINRVL